MFTIGSGVLGRGATGNSDVCCVLGVENTGAGSGSVVTSNGNTPFKSASSNSSIMSSNSTLIYLFYGLV